MIVHDAQMSLCLPSDAVCIGLQFSMSNPPAEAAPGTRLCSPSSVGDDPPLLLLLL